MAYTQPEWGIRLSSYFLLPQRIILSIMGFFALLNAFTMRGALSIVITQLVKEKNYTEKENGDIAVCPVDSSTNGTNTTATGEYDWSEPLQGFILSSFYIGYLITHVPGGILADKFGGKWTLGLGILSTAIFTLIHPICIEWGGSTALIIIRILMGFGEGTTFPAISVLLSKWVPIKERGTLGSLVLGGGQVGTIICNLIAGELLSKFDWPIVFYVFGSVGVVWFIIFTLLCYSDPSLHPFIKPSEKKYIFETVEGSDGNNKKKLPPTPWISIMTNVPMLVLISAQIGHDWGFYIMINDLPKYMADVLRFPIKSNGLYSSLPYLAMWICSLLFGAIGDILIRRKFLSITNSRKFMTGLAAFGPAIFLVAASYAGCDRMLVVALFTIAMGLMGAFYAGMKLTPLDLSPNYAGTLMAITNGIGALTGVIAPFLVGVMAPNATLLEWRLVFWVAFGVLTLTALVYVFWASGEIQAFNDPPKTHEVEDKDNMKKETKAIIAVKSTVNEKNVHDSAINQELEDKETVVESTKSIEVRSIVNAEMQENKSIINESTRSITVNSIVNESLVNESNKNHPVNSVDNEIYFIIPQNSRDLRESGSFVNESTRRIAGNSIVSEIDFNSREVQERESVESKMSIAFSSTKHREMVTNSSTSITSTFSSSVYEKHEI